MKIVFDTNCLVRILLKNSNYRCLWDAFLYGKDDNKFVDCAISANADYIVSNDRHFNVLKDLTFPKVNLIDIDSFKKAITII